MAMMSITLGLLYSYTGVENLSVLELLVDIDGHKLCHALVEFVLSKCPK